MSKKKTIKQKGKYKNVNKYGLQRDPGDPIKREIRQMAGFGCVFCGLGIHEYEHVDPVFVDAKEHDPASMTLLCPNHHREVTSGFISKQDVKDAMLNPKALQIGYADNIFRFTGGKPKLQLGTFGAVNEQGVIVLGDKRLLEIVASEENEEQFYINAMFYDTLGHNTLNIVENQWQAKNRNWDVQVVGPKITIREKKGKIVLVLEKITPDILCVSRLDMIVDGVNIVVNDKGLQLYNANDVKRQGGVTFSNITFETHNPGGQVNTIKIV